MSSPSTSSKIDCTSSRRTRQSTRQENSFKAIMLPSAVGMADSIMVHVLA